MALVEFQNVTRVYKTGDHELKALDGASFTRVNPKFCVNSIWGANRAKLICGGSRLVRLPPW